MPSPPTIAVTADGSGLAVAVSGVDPPLLAEDGSPLLAEDGSPLLADSGVVVTAYVAPFLAGGEPDWAASGTRTGDGPLAVALAAGRYWVSAEAAGLWAAPVLAVVPADQLLPVEDDVFDAVRDRLAADPDYAAALPGGVHAYGRPRAGLYPYAVVTVEAAGREWFSDGSYLQAFAVGVAVVTTRSDTLKAETRRAARAVARCFGWVPGDPAGGLAVANAAATAQVRPLTGSVAVDLGDRATTDRVTASWRSEVTVEGRRGPADTQGDTDMGLDYRVQWAGGLQLKANGLAYSSRYGTAPAPGGDLRLADGTGPGQANSVYEATFDLEAAGGADAALIDLKGGGGEKDVLNVALAMTAVKSVEVVVASPLSTKSVKLGPQNKTNAAQLWFGGTGAADYAAVRGRFANADAVSGWPLDGTHKVLALVNPSAVPVTVWVRVVGLK